MKWKEIPENGKKLIMILTFVFIIFFVSGCMYGKAYAYTNDDQAITSAITYYETNFKSTYPYMFLLRGADGNPQITSNQKYTMFISTDKFSIDNSNVDSWRIGNQQSYSYKKLAILRTADSWSVNPQTVNGILGGYQEASVIYSNHNITTLTSAGTYNDTVFFSPPQQPILPNQVQPQLLTPVLVQVVSVLPILLVCLIGFLGLRKGLSILQQILHQA